MNKKVVFYYALAGALFGAVFPIVATSIRILTNEMPFNWESIVAVQSADPLQWIIDTAPIFLGLFAAIGGIRQARVLELHQEQQNKIEELRITTQELRMMEAELEQRVADRTNALQTSAEVSRKLSTILDLSQLVREVVEQLQAAFGYYHAHIYLFDDMHDYLVMAGGSGEAGRTLLERGHKIAQGKGLVGRAAEGKAPVLVSDVNQDPSWLPNPLLPETRSELAVPISQGDDVLGVLDVQQNRPGALTEDDARLLSSIASQVAIALRNAQSYKTARRQGEQEAARSLIAENIRRSNTIEETLQVLLHELSAATSAKRTSVLVGTPQRSPTTTGADLG